MSDGNRVLNEAITAFYDGLMDKLAKRYGEDYDELIEMWGRLHALYLENANRYLEKWARDAAGPHAETGVKQITANTVIIEVTDKETGRVFRRTLPVDYLETDNGIRLSGDTLEGTPSHLAFLSDAAVLRMKGIMGQAPDEHRCHED